MGDNDFGRFHLLERIGAGGMGEVFRAEMRSTDGFSRVVVVKRMLPDLAADADAVASFVHEAKLAARIIHPNVVQVHDFGKVGARYYLVMEYVAGCDLARLLAMQRMQERKLVPNAAVTIAAALLNGLEFAHALRDGDGQPLYLVHRDVTPGNVLLGTAGEIKLSDFGIAKTRERLEHTRVGAVKGKWNYMSPEQARGASWLDARSDLFAVGVVLYEMLTAERPFKGKTGRDVAAAVQSGQYPPPEGVGPGLTEVIKRALQTKIEARYQSARGFREVLLARAAADGIQPDPDLLRTLVEEAATAFAAPPMPPRPASTEPAASDREATDVMDHGEPDAVATAPARRPPPSAPRLPPAEVVSEPTPVAAAIQQPSVTATSVSVVIKPKHFVLGGVALGLLVVATFVIAARISHVAAKPHTVRVALRMYPAQEQWFVEHVFKPFGEREGCKVEIVEFNSTEELTRIIANGEVDMSKIDVEHAPVLVELGQLQRISALGERVDPQGYAELIGQLRPEALQLGRFHTTVGDDLYMLPRKLETALLAYRRSLVALAAAEWAKQRAALDKRLEGVLGHGLPEGFDLSPDPARWTTWDVVAAAWVWAHTPIDGRTEPRYAVRPEKRVLMEAVAGGAPGSEPWRVSPALVDVFFTYAVLRELDVLNAESVKPEADWLRLRDLLAHKSIAAFDEVQIDIGILTGNGHGLPQLIDDPKDLDVAPLPRLASLARGETTAQESRTEIWGWGWGVPRNSREPELAMRLIMTILSHDRHAAELEEFPILRVRKDVAPEWPISKRTNEVGDAQLATGRGLYIDWPKRAGDLERFEQRINKAYREVIVDRHYGSADHAIDRAVIEGKLRQILDVTD
jgi:serine/threonine protein kinase/ABC-type glycerol-3-phosphate transport system substrate-binding protein